MRRSLRPVLVVAVWFVHAPFVSAEATESDLSLTEEAAAAMVTDIRNDPSRDPSYPITITESDAVDLVRGIPLDPEDPEFCAKKRDLCLAFTCGAFSRDRMPNACWDHCTKLMFERCEAEAAGSTSP